GMRGRIRDWRAIAGMHVTERSEDGHHLRVEWQGAIELRIVLLKVLSKPLQVAYRVYAVELAFQRKVNVNALEKRNLFCDNHVALRGRQLLRSRFGKKVFQGSQAGPLRRGASYPGNGGESGRRGSGAAGEHRTASDLVHWFLLMGNSSLHWAVMLASRMRR